MKTKAILTMIALVSASILPSCTTVVDPSPMQPVTTQQTTTETSPYTGSTSYKKTTTTTAY